MDGIYPRKGVLRVKRMKENFREIWLALPTNQTNRHASHQPLFKVIKPKCNRYRAVLSVHRIFNPHTAIMQLSRVSLVQWRDRSQAINIGVFPVSTIPPVWRKCNVRLSIQETQRGSAVHREYGEPWTIRIATAVQNPGYSHSQQGSQLFLSQLVINNLTMTYCCAYILEIPRCYMVCKF